MTPKEKAIVNKVAKYIKDRFSKDKSGHDWYHMLRVWQTAKFIGKQEKANMFIVELGALLHDIADAKFHHGDHSVGPKRARALLKKIGLDESAIEKVVYIVGNVSFSKTGRKQNMQTLEGQVVQDADRLDAVGAICVARIFTYGGWQRRPIFDPRVKPFKNMPIPLAHKGASSFHHFYEKILNVKDLMNTKTGKRLAKSRHDFTELYLKQFLAEWDGKDLK
ncbi:MAG: HD domain-containing protein [Patescibacteria group bacterium]|jgi:uncharacterized protein